jgi:FkbM family methyltransferase
MSYCNCSQSGYCQTYDRIMSPRMVEICRGEALKSDGTPWTEQQCNIMRANWMAEAWGRGNTESLTCTYRGEQIGVRNCQTCGHRTETTPLFYCSLFGRCTLKTWMVGQQEATCAGCGSRKSLKPKLVDRIRVSPSHMLPNEFQFNNSLIRYNGRLLMAYRVGWKDARIAILELSPNGQPIRNSWIALKYGSGQEDPRLFVFQGQLHVSYTAFNKCSNRDGGYTDLCYARLRETENGWNTDEDINVKYSGRQLWEKNWGFFEYEDELYCVYSISPHKVLKIKNGRGFVIAETSNPIKKVGNLHGGAPPVYHRGEFYCFYHRRLGLSSEKFYSIDLYTFEAKPPFRPSRHIELPILIADRKDRPGETVPHALFPGGAFIDDLHRWTVSFGYYDKWSEIAWWDINDVEACLVALPGGPMANIVYRKGTNDLSMWKEVYEWNEYDLPKNFSSSDVIIDIGAHIGSFSRACLDRGAGYVVAIEPFADSFKLMEQNLSYYPQRSDRLQIAIGGERRIAQLRNPDKRGNSFVAVSATGEKGTLVGEVDCHPLSYVLDSSMKVRMIKLDCEGAEYEILENCNLSLENVQEILGEAHRVKRGDRELDMSYLQTLLERKGFKVESKEVSPVTWLFKAVR